jgi:hypothetical protein
MTLCSMRAMRRAAAWRITPSVAVALDSRSLPQSFSSSHMPRRSAQASREYRPCFQFAVRQRRPSAVRGPVLLPPCSRQRPFGKRPRCLRAG